MIVTAAEFKTNFGKYLDMLLSEDIFITRNGKTIAKMVNSNDTNIFLDVLAEREPFKKDFLLFGITLLTPEELLEMY